MAIEAGDKLVDLTDLKSVYDKIDVIKANKSVIESGTQQTKINHLGFYLDSNGDLCYDQ